MHAPGRRIDEGRQSVGIGRFEFCKLPPIENACREFVALLGEIVEHARRRGPGAGRGFLGAGEAHLAKENIAELFWRAEIEGLAGEFVDRRLEPRHVLREFAREALRGWRGRS